MIHNMQSQPRWGRGAQQLEIIIPLINGARMFHQVEMLGIMVITRREHIGTVFMSNSKSDDNLLLWLQGHHKAHVR